MAEPDSAPAEPPGNFQGFKSMWLLYFLYFVPSRLIWKSFCEKDSVIRPVEVEHVCGCSELFTVAVGWNTRVGEVFAAEEKAF